MTGNPLRIGRYLVEDYVNYIKENPEAMDRILKLYNDFDLNGLKEFIEKLDLDKPFKPSTLSHRRYIECKDEIDTIIRNPESYPIYVRSSDYLDDYYIKEIFENSAEKYDEIWDGILAYELREEVISWLDLKPDEKMLEVGIGTGNNLKYFPRGVEIVGIDYSSAMLNIAEMKIEQAGSDKIKLLKMDAHNMTFSNDCFDKALCFYSLCSVRDPKRVLKEVNRVCKKGGKLVVFDVIKSEISEVALVQYLFRPIAKKLGAIYLEFSPPYIITYDSLFDLYSLIQGLGFTLEKSKYMDPLKTIALLSFQVS